MDEIDPIDELHQIREMLYKKAGGTPQAYVKYVMEQQKEYADRLVDLSKPEPAKKKSRRRSAVPV